MLPPGFRMRSPFPLPLPELHERHPPPFPGQHHAQSRWPGNKIDKAFVTDGDMIWGGRWYFFKWSESSLSGLYHDALIATNLALHLSPNLVVSFVFLYFWKSFLTLLYHWYFQISHFTMANIYTSLGDMEKAKQFYMVRNLFLWCKY